MTRKLKSAEDGLVSIGQAVGALKDRYPALTISKVRFLEDEGLLKLSRTKGGYRLFTKEDLNRLSEILRLQKELFLPLAVIKERMRGWRHLQADPNGDPVVVEKEKANGDEAVSINDALSKAGVELDAVKVLESFGLIKLVERGDGLALSTEDTWILAIFAELKNYGIEPRHLRMYENQAQREAVLFQQILTPHLKNRSKQLQEKSHTDLLQLIALTERLKKVLLKKAIKEGHLV